MLPKSYGEEQVPVHVREHFQMCMFANISRNEARCVKWDKRDAKMPSLHKLLQCALALLFVCTAINAAHAEIASVYGASDGPCGSRTANGERVCSAMTATHRTLPF
jgi:rare lipoprotein A (peptidoglycan hydrolase)